MSDQEIDALNTKFNDDLDKYEKHQTPQGYRMNLGYPSKYLRNVGFPYLPISLRTGVIGNKSNVQRHLFAASDLKDLVKAIQKPIAIIRYSKDNMRNIIVDIAKDNKHFLVEVTMGFKSGDLEINSVSGLFPKEDHEWLKWIQDGKAMRIDDKVKAQDIINSLRMNPAESERIGLDLNMIANIVNNFVNPKVDENNSETRQESAGENGTKASLRNRNAAHTRVDGLAQGIYDKAVSGKAYLNGTRHGMIHLRPLTNFRRHW